MNNEQTREHIFLRNLNENLFKGTPYQYTAGGRPNDIPDGKFEEFKEFFKN
jgi:Zn-dependent M16 (insulinase) family peptidase